MAFTYDLAADRGKVRLKLSDTNPAGYGFEDAEIDALLTEGGTVTKAVILGLRVLLVDAARRAKAVSTGGVSYNDAGRVAGIQAALKLYGGELPDVTVVSVGAQPYDSGYVEQAVITSS
jgi:hypothetical protein